jgi:prolyl-tRNA editing enzyme YbaK/EbsC (Cys-tRNA(Pro) deacylase)
MTATKTSADLQRYIDAHGIAAAILPMNGHTPTVSDAARELGVAVDQVIKSLVFVLDDDPLLVINNGLARVDRRRLAAVLGVGRKRVKFARPEQALTITGFMVGSMPPFGHCRPLRTLLDVAVMGLPHVFGGGGDIDAMLRIAPLELLRVTQGEVHALAERTAGAATNEALI